MNKDIFMCCGAMLSCMAWGGPMAAASGLLTIGTGLAITKAVDSSSTMHKILLVAGVILAASANLFIVFHAAPLMFGTALALESALDYYIVTSIVWCVCGGVAGLVASLVIDVFQNL